MYIKISILFVVACIFAGCMSPRKDTTGKTLDIDPATLPRQIYWEEDKFHVQGVAVDIKNGYVYFSFTTKLVKTDLNGRLIGSVDGMTGHLGCIDIHPENGKIYGSLEYKNDVIGKGILKGLQDGDSQNVSDAFYIAIFDGDKITRPGMSAETDGVLTTVYLQEVVDDYIAVVTNQGKEVKHRYGCSGIDGTAFGPQFGTSGKGTSGKGTSGKGTSGKGTSGKGTSGKGTSGKGTSAAGSSGGDRLYLHVAYGIYGDTTRTDNDYQVILQYDVSDWDQYAQPLLQSNPHRSGPRKPLEKYFVFTGNSTYGIQNLAYDAATGYWFAAVYKGKKSQYPNYSLFTIDGAQNPRVEPLKGFDTNEQGKIIALAKAGIHDEKSNLYGWQQKWGSTGIHAFENGYFYLSQNGTTPDKKQYCKLQLYRWTGQAPDPFEAVP